MSNQGLYLLGVCGVERIRQPTAGENKGPQRWPTHDGAGGLCHHQDEARAHATVRDGGTLPPPTALQANVALGPRSAVPLRVEGGASRRLRGPWNGLLSQR